MAGAATHESALSEESDAENIRRRAAAEVEHIGPPASRRRAISRARYAAYIESDAWRTSPARLAEMLASGGRCRLCDAGPESRVIHVHHRCYDRLGHERPEDLTALCDECHGVVTDMLRRRDHAQRALPSAEDVEDRLADRKLVDSRPTGA